MSLGRAACGRKPLSSRSPPLWAPFVQSRRARVFESSIRLEAYALSRAKRSCLQALDHGVDWFSKVVSCSVPMSLQRSAASRSLAWRRSASDGAGVVFRPPLRSCSSASCQRNPPHPRQPADRERGDAMHGRRRDIDGSRGGFQRKHLLDRGTSARRPPSPSLAVASNTSAPCSESRSGKTHSLEGGWIERSAVHNPCRRKELATPPYRLTVLRLMMTRSDCATAVQRLMISPVPDELGPSSPPPRRAGEGGRSVPPFAR